MEIIVFFNLLIEVMVGLWMGSKVIFLQYPTAVMAEWLRRWTRNPMGSSRVGSNPTHSEIFI